MIKNAVSKEREVVARPAFDEHSRAWPDYKGTKHTEILVEAQKQ